MIPFWEGGAFASLDGMVRGIDPATGGVITIHPTHRRPPALTMNGNNKDLRSGTPLKSGSTATTPNHLWSKDHPLPLQELQSHLQYTSNCNIMAQAAPLAKMYSIQQKGVVSFHDSRAHPRHRGVEVLR